MACEERDRFTLIDFEETELRLGLPGGRCNDVAGEEARSGGKRGFSGSIDLKLNISSTEEAVKEKSIAAQSNDPAKPPAAKEQVVGWPPVRSFRRNLTTVPKNQPEESNKTSNAAALVKVSMDGAPHLRKIDLKLYKSYHQLSGALDEMFSSYTTGNCGSKGMKDFMNENKFGNSLNSSGYVPTYEDKDGDWMLVGDVPWEMFVDSCKRLRIMKGSRQLDLDQELRIS